MLLWFLLFAGLVCFGVLLVLAGLLFLLVVICVAFNCILVEVVLGLVMISGCVCVC